MSQLVMEMCHVRRLRVTMTCREARMVLASSMSCVVVYNKGAVCSKKNRGRWGRGVGVWGEAIKHTFLTNSIGCLHSGSAFLGSESSAAVFLVKLLFTQLNSPVHYAYPPHASTIAPVHKVGRE